MSNGIMDLHDIDLEKSVLGACLIDPDAIRKIADVIEPHDFHDEGHQALYEAIRSLYYQGADVDYLVVSRTIPADRLGKIGINGTRGAAYLTELITSTPTSLNVEQYAAVVQRLSTLRKLMAAAGGIAQLAYGGRQSDVDALFEQARRMVDAAAPQIADNTTMYWKDSIDHVFVVLLQLQELRSRADSGDPTAIIDFPWDALNRYVPALLPGTLTAVCAEPGVGKTTFMECLAEHWARKGMHVVFFHYELSTAFMELRRMSRWTGIPFVELQKKGGVRQEMKRAREIWESWPGAIHLIHCPGWTAQRTVNHARRLQDRGLCDIAILDYLGMIHRVYANGLNPAQVVGQQIATLKTGADQMGAPWAVAAQFNKSSRGKNLKTADDIRDTGELEDKSNLLITLDRPLDFTTGKRVSRTNGYISKNTMGEQGLFELQFTGARYLFSDVEERTF